MSNPRPDPITVEGMTDAITNPGATLTPDERAAAARMGMTEDRYASLKEVRTINDWWRSKGVERPDGPSNTGPREVDTEP